MRKYLVNVFLVALVILIALPAYAETRTKRVIVETPLSSTSGSLVPVASTATAYTKSMSLVNVERLAVMYKAESAGTVQLKVDFEQSYHRPTTEAAVDSTYLFTEVVDASLVDEDWHMVTIDTLTPLPFGRFVIVGSGSNHAATTIEFKVGKQ